MVSAIVVAAGKGRRMQRRLPKQYLPLGGKPILSRTLEGVDACPAIDRILLVAAEPDFDFCREHVLGPIQLKKPIRLVAGGAERQDSVFLGLQAVEDPAGIVVIHDGVRPFASPKTFDDCIQAASADGACICAVPVAETVKQATAAGRILQTIDRTDLWQAQTPQAFQYGVIREAHEAARRDGYLGTDDAQLVERLGRRVTIIAGSRLNIKITTPEDLELAEAFLQKESFRRNPIFPEGFGESAR